MKHVLIALATSVALFSCQGNTATETATAIENAKQATIDSMNTISAVKQRVIDSMNTVNAGRSRHAATAASNSQYENSGAAVPATTETPAAAPAPAKKKGWSHTAKGAVVGAGAGAVTGAIVNKDHLKGAAIGTLIGAGAGAATGAIVDHSKKKKSVSQ